VKLSVVIPAYNEDRSIAEAVAAVDDQLAVEGIDHEVVVVDDSSTDHTAEIVARLAEERPAVRYLRSCNPKGFGYAVRAGLDAFAGDAVAIFMADLSDDPADLVTYYKLLDAGFDCAFGSRFLPGSHVENYPRPKLWINRLVNWGIRLLFGHGYNDTTNAFKAYRREVIDVVQPLISPHFNLTVELPLKAIVRGHSYAIAPISWRNRSYGGSNLRLQEMGSRYLFIVLYVFFEHHLSRGDYRRPGAAIRRGHFGHAATPGAMARMLVATREREHDA
jgi:dolichol-phosphate mannosyltransferase